MDSEAKLLHLLSSIQRTKDSLPLLLRTFSTPSNSNSTSTSTNPIERSLIYNSRSTTLNTNLKNLAIELESCSTILSDCEKSEREDSKGIIIRERKGDGEGWNRLNEVLGEVTNNSNSSDKGKSKEIYVNALEEVESIDKLEEWIQNWKSKHSNVTVELIGDVKECREIKLILRGVMRAVIMLYWKKGIVTVERVACFSLKEANKSNYLQSQFTLFQTITNTAMEKIGKHSLRSAQKGRVSNLEEILEFLAAPPLPF